MTFHWIANKGLSATLDDGFLKFSTVRKAEIL